MGWVGSITDFFGWNVSYFIFVWLVGFILFSSLLPCCRWCLRSRVPHVSFIVFLSSFLNFFSTRARAPLPRLAHTLSLHPRRPWALPMLSPSSSILIVICVTTPTNLSPSCSSALSSTLWLACRHHPHRRGASLTSTRHRRLTTPPHACCRLLTLSHS